MLLFRSSPVVKTPQNSNCNQVKTYSRPLPSTPAKSLIPKRREMREDPYKIAIRESQKISMERGIERNDLSYQIKMLEEYDRSKEIPSNTEPGFQMQPSDWLMYYHSDWMAFESLLKLALYDEVDLERSKKLNRHLTLEKIKYKLVKLLLRHSHGIAHFELKEAYCYLYGRDDTDLASLNYSFTSPEFLQQVRNCIAITDNQSNRLDINTQYFHQEQGFDRGYFSDVRD